MSNRPAYCSDLLLDCIAWTINTLTVANGLSKFFIFILEICATYFFRKMRRGTKLGVFGLQRWTEGRKITRVLSWRARIWAETFLGRRALDEWWRHIRHQRDVEASGWIVENRMKRWKIARFDISPSVMQHTVVRALDKNALANRLQRAVLRAWVERTQLVAKARQKVQSLALKIPRRYR